MAEPRRARMSAAEFLRWQEFQDEKFELVDGEPVLYRMMTGARQRHDIVTMNALALLHNQLRGRPCRAMTSDLAISIPSGGLRRADAAVDCGEIRGDDMIATQPVLVVEVLSPSTRQIDRFRKLEEYKSVPSMRHILLVEPSTPAAKLYSRAGEDRWTSADFIGLDTVVNLDEPDLTLPLRELYEGLTFEAADTWAAGAPGRG